MSYQSAANQLISVAGILAKKKTASKTKVSLIKSTTQAPVVAKPTEKGGEQVSPPEEKKSTPLQTKSLQIDKEVIDIPSTGSPYSRRVTKKKAKMNRMSRGRMSALIRVQADRQRGYSYGKE